MVAVARNCCDYNSAAGRVSHPPLLVIILVFGRYLCMQLESREISLGGGNAVLEGRNPRGGPASGGVEARVELDSV